MTKVIQWWIRAQDLWRLCNEFVGLEREKADLKSKTITISIFDSGGSNAE